MHSHRRHDRRVSQLRLPVAGVGPTPALRNDGLPFKTEAQARLASNSRKDLKGRGYRPVMVEGGWGLAILDPRSGPVAAASGSNRSLIMTLIMIALIAIASLGQLVGDRHSEGPGACFEREGRAIEPC